MSEQYIDAVGSFTCEVEKPESWLGESGEKNTPYLRLPLVVTDDGDQQGRRITWFGWLSEKAFDNTIKALCKAFPTWDGDLQTLVAGKFSFEGLPCQIVTEAEDYKGERRIKAKWLNPLGGGGSGGKPLEAQKVADLLKRMGPKAKAIAKATRAEGGAPAPRPTPGPAPAAARPEDGPLPEDNEDIPY